jgi:hypothetical protein
MTRLRDLLGKPPQSVHLPAWVDRLLSIGIVSTDPEVVGRQRFVNVGVLATVGSTISHIIMLSLHDFYGLLPINIYNLFMIFVPPLIPLLHRYGENIGAIALATLLLFGHSLVVCLLGLASDLQIYFTFFPSIFLLLVGVRRWRLFLVFFALSGSARDLADLCRLMDYSSAGNSAYLVATGHDQYHVDHCRGLLRADRAGSTKVDLENAATDRMADRHHDAAPDRRAIEGRRGRIAVASRY